MAKKTSSKIKINIICLVIFSFLFIQFISASHTLDYDIYSSQYIVRINASNKTTISTIDIPNYALYYHINNSFYNNNTLYKIINNTDSKELRYFDFYNESYENYQTAILLNPLKDSEIILKTYESDTPNTEIINILKKEIIPVYLYLFSKDDYIKLNDPINNTVNLTAGIPYLLNLYKRSTTIEQLFNISKKIKINNKDMIILNNYTENGTQLYLYESLQQYKKYTKQLNGRFFFEKIENFTCNSTIHYKISVDLQDFEFNINFQKPQINDIYLMVDIFIDEPDNDNFQRIYKMVDLFIEC